VYAAANVDNEKAEFKAVLISASLGNVPAVAIAVYPTLVPVDVRPDA
jgi:hypothetical protein